MTKGPTSRTMAGNSPSSTTMSSPARTPWESSRRRTWAGIAWGTRYTKSMQTSGRVVARTDPESREGGAGGVKPFGGPFIWRVVAFAAFALCACGGETAPRLTSPQDESPPDTVAWFIEPTTVSLRDSVRGQIEDVGEVDRYLIPLTVGDEFQVSLRSIDGSTRLKLLAPDSITEIVSMEDHQGSAPEHSYSRVVRVKRGGTYIFSVTHREAVPQGHHRYVFAAQPIDRRPEGGGALRTGDTLRSEAIEQPVADVDEFRIALSAGERIQVHLDVEDPRPFARLRLTIYRPSFDTFYTGDMPTDSVGWFPFRAFTAPTSAEYVIRTGVAENDETRPKPIGRYAIALPLIDPAPEKVARQIRMGDTVRGEEISAPRGGDLDEFEISLVAGDSVRVYLNPLGWEASNRLRIELRNPLGQSMVAISVAGGGAGNTSLGVLVRQTGTHRVQLTATDDQFGSGPYEFSVVGRP